MFFFISLFYLFFFFFFFFSIFLFYFFFFFFQAEDGIRDADVTGVQTCALPILTSVNEVSNGISTFLKVSFILKKTVHSPKGSPASPMYLITVCVRNIDIGDRKSVV